MLDLIIGAEGTLGIVAEIEWRLDHIPPFRAGLRVHLASLDRLSDLVIALNRCEPSALELLDRTFLDLVGAGAWGGVSDGFVPEAILLVELERSDPEALREVLAAVTEAIQPWATSIETAYSPPQAERLWAIRHAASPILAGLPEDRRSLQVIEDACVPIERMGEYIRICSPGGRRPRSSCGDVRPCRRRAHPREPASRSRKGRLGGGRRRTARGSDRRRRPAGRHPFR